MGDTEGAWDVTQQSWLAIIKGMGRLQDPACFKSWAYQITTNHSVDLKEDSLLTMVKVFYSRKMRSIAIVVWVWALIFLGGSIVCGIRFFATTETRGQILYAALFVCFFHGIGLMKIFAWSMIQRHSIRREIKRLELCFAELLENMKI